MPAWTSASRILPQIEGTAGRFMLKQMALVAELEAGFISERTKAALAAAKRRGKKLGGYRVGAKLTVKARQKGAKANAEAAAARAADLAPVIADLQASGATSCVPSQALSMTGVSRRLEAASGSRRPSVTCSPGSERKRLGLRVRTRAGTRQDEARQTADRRGPARSP
jgi:DNA invertase Pin-like site-specific DNA recombinase